jgi:hypothetical protein
MKVVPNLTTLLSKPLLLVFFVTFSINLTAQGWQKVFSDTTVFSFDTVTIANKKFIGFLKEQSFFLLNSNGDTLLKKDDYYSMSEFKDFNKDGYRDVILRCSRNAAMVLDLFFYIPSTGKFKEVKDFRKFPAPESIKGTIYYYSYHKSGCADMNWDSDLFYIKNYKTIRIGNIAGRQCNNRNGIKDAVYIRKVRDAKESLFKTASIDTIWRYNDSKWGFIKEYWSKNYNLFL